MDKINIAFLMHKNPTASGSLMSEIKLLNELYKHNEDDINFSVISTSPYYTKLVDKWVTSKVLTIPFNIIPLYEGDSLEVLQNISGIVTYNTDNNLFAGAINSKQVQAYKILSHVTNNMDIPVFIRLSDSGSDVVDYRDIIYKRSFSDPGTTKLANIITNIPRIDYSKYKWLCNGQETKRKWVGECLYKAKESIRVVNSIKEGDDNAIYVGDDPLFLVSNNYKKYSYLDNGHTIDELLFIGYFTNIHKHRYKVFNELYKGDNSPPTRVFGVNTDKLNTVDPNLKITEGFIQGDSTEYFEFLSKHIAYLFIGKGPYQADYIGKTVYDCLNARTPILVYSKSDPDRITFTNEEYYFNDIEDLQKKYKLLRDPLIRKKWLDDQTQQVFSQMGNTFFFRDYCKPKPKLNIATQEALF